MSKLLIFFEFDKENKAVSREQHRYDIGHRAQGSGRRAQGAEHRAQGGRTASGGRLAAHRL